MGNSGFAISNSSASQVVIAGGSGRFGHGGDQVEKKMCNIQLLAAARDGQADLVLEALKQGARTEARQPMRICVGGRNSPKSGNTHGKASKHKGPTPLMLASQSGSVECIRMLLKARARLHAKDEDGMRPLHFAASSGEFGALQELLNARANPEALDRNQQSVIDHLPEEVRRYPSELKRWVDVLAAATTCEQQEAEDGPDGGADEAPVTQEEEAAATDALPSKPSRSSLLSQPPPQVSTPSAPEVTPEVPEDEEPTFDVDDAALEEASAQETAPAGEQSTASMAKVVTVAEAKEAAGSIDAAEAATTGFKTGKLTANADEDHACTQRVTEPIAILSSSELRFDDDEWMAADFTGTVPEEPTSTVVPKFAAIDLDSVLELPEQLHRSNVEAGPSLVGNSKASSKRVSRRAAPSQKEAGTGKGVKSSLLTSTSESKDVRKKRQAV